MGKTKFGAFFATIEPWHGNQVVIYTAPEGTKEYSRLVLDDHLRWGHAVRCADLDGDGSDEIIVGVRDNPKPGDTSASAAACGFTRRRPTC